MRRVVLTAALVVALGCVGGELAAEPGPTGTAGDRRSERERMIEEQITARGVQDPAVLTALRRVPRHEFVGERWRPYAYDDRALPIDAGQTISQPYIVALMSELAAVKL